MQVKIIKNGFTLQESLQIELKASLIQAEPRNLSRILVQLLNESNLDFWFSVNVPEFMLRLLPILPPAIRMSLMSIYDPSEYSFANAYAHILPTQNPAKLLICRSNICISQIYVPLLKAFSASLLIDSDLLAIKSGLNEVSVYIKEEDFIHGLVEALLNVTT